MSKLHHMYIPAKEFKIPRVANVMKNTCEFDRYQDGKLWYLIRWYAEADVVPAHLDPQAWEVIEEHRFEFPIPVEDSGAGAFKPEMKAINLMRWIRKHIDFLTEAQVGEQDGG